MTNDAPSKYFRTSPGLILLAVMLYVRFALSLRIVEDAVHERSIDIFQETVRFWWNRFRPIFASELRARRAERQRSGPQWRWYLDKVFVKIDGEHHYLWRAVDH